ncbi:MAG: fluoride efflux transporter FluC [Sporichthyaceae bacterium]
MSWILVALGAAGGAPARYALDQVLRARTGSAFPWGTFTANLLGSLLLGLVLASAAGGGASPDLVLLTGVGFCGAFTTYSTLAFEVLVLHESRRNRLGTGYLLSTIALGAAAAAVGIELGSRF